MYNSNFREGFPNQIGLSTKGKKQILLKSLTYHFGLKHNTICVCIPVLLYMRNIFFFFIHIKAVCYEKSKEHYHVEIIVFFYKYIIKIYTLENNMCNTMKTYFAEKKTQQRLLHVPFPCYGHKFYEKNKCFTNGSLRFKFHFFYKNSNIISKNH